MTQRDRSSRMRPWEACLVLASAALVIAAADHRGTVRRFGSVSGDACAGTDTVAMLMQRDLIWSLTDTTASVTTFRSDAGLVGADPSNVTVVLDSVQCHGARASYYARIGDSTPSTPVSLLRISPTRYAVGDSATRRRLGAYALMDSAFTVLGLIPY